MSSALKLATLLAVLLFSSQNQKAVALHKHPEGDFGFDVNEDLDVEFTENIASERSHKDPPLVQQFTHDNNEFNAVVGHVFHLEVPKVLFGEGVQTFDVKKHNGETLPSWLLFEKTSGMFWGIPLPENEGSLHLTINGIGGDKTTSKRIIIDVEPNTTGPQNKPCPDGEDRTILTLLIDKGLRAIKPKQRIVAVNDISKFFGLPYSAFVLKSEATPDDITDSSVVLAGPGNLHSRVSKQTSLLEVPVGCDGRLWMETAPLVHQLKQQAKDGTISEVLRLPLIGWRVKTETRPVIRNKRQNTDDAYGSGDYDDEYYDNYPDEYDENGDAVTTIKSTSTSTTPVPTTTTTTTTEKPTTLPEVSSTHPHRHHHGEPKFDETNIYHHTSPKQQETTSTTTTTTEKPTTTTEKLTDPPSSPVTTSTTQMEETTTTKIVVLTPETTPPSDDDYDYGTIDENDDDDDEESETIVPDITKQTIELKTTTESKPTTLQEVVFVTEASSTPKIIYDQEPDVVVVLDKDMTTVMPTTTQEDETTEQQTTQTTTTTTTTTEAPTTIIIPVDTVTTTTETVPTTVVEEKTTTTTTTTQESPTTVEEEETESNATTDKVTTRDVTTTTTTQRTLVTDSIEYETKNFHPHIENRLKQKYVIAGKIFRFVIPSNTFKDFEDGYSLTFEFLDAFGKSIGNDSWCQFNKNRSEIYGLPLETDVSKWEYIIRASDKDGASIDDHLTIQVQQHKLQRVVNHEFSLELRIEKHDSFKHFVDWSLKILRAFGRIYNTNMSEITVRKVNYTTDPVVFTWTNDSLPTNYCPTGDINNLFKVLTANDRGDPSRELNIALAPELRVKKVSYLGIGVCKEQAPITPKTPAINYPPILRNPVDHINATVGELLIFKVPEDTFYDPEDFDSRTLNISLLTGDRQEIPAHNWLQFDSTNREFYGIPTKAGQSEYQLVCVDRGGLPVTDSLVVEVHHAPRIPYNVEFSMTLLKPADVFGSTVTQKKFVEKLTEIFGDQNASHIHFQPFRQKQDSIIITWFNKSLPTDHCAHEEITRLESVLKSNDHGIAHRVHSIMDPDFPVSTIKVLEMNNCKTVQTKVIPNVKKPSIVTDSKELDEVAPPSTHDDYMLTFIVPGVIISIMIFVALLAACILYRRRHSGKLNVVEEGRQSYGNKGIPVIFQEELDEKPENGGTKAPVILKDEKPPLAPPEYSRSGTLRHSDISEPYQPPPPFTRSHDNDKSRPKPMPTYRKPPPYVPP